MMPSDSRRWRSLWIRIFSWRPWVSGARPPTPWFSPLHLLAPTSLTSRPSLGLHRPVSQSMLPSLGVRQTWISKPCSILGLFRHWAKAVKSLRRRKFKNCTRTSSTTAPSSSISLVEERRDPASGNIRPFCSTGTTSSFVVPNRSNAWSKTCLWPKPWLVVTSWRWAWPFLLAYRVAWPRRLSTRPTCTRVDLFGCFNCGCRLTSPCFGRRFLTFSLLRRLVFNWPPDRCPLIRLRKSSSSSLVSKTSPTTSSSCVVVAIILPPLIFRLLFGAKMRMVPFDKIRGHSCYRATFHSAVMLAGQAGRSIIPNSPPGNLVTSKAARCLYFAPVPFLAKDGSLVRLRRNVETPRRSSKSGANNSVSDRLFLRPSASILSGTGGKHIPRTSSGGQSRILLPRSLATVPRKLLPLPLRRRTQVVGCLYLPNVYFTLVSPFYHSTLILIFFS